MNRYGWIDKYFEINLCYYRDMQAFYVDVNEQYQLKNKGLRLIAFKYS